MGLCLIISGLFSFSGCSLVKEDATKVNSNVVMKIGNTELTKAEVISAFYTYYQNNSSYFSYYEDSVIEESFYTWLTVKTLVEDMSIDVLYDAEKNPNGFIYYTKDDAETVWETVEDYFYEQVSTQEKELYAKKKYKEDEYPIWLQAEESDDKDTAFKPYSSPVSEIVLEDRKSKVAEKLTEKEVYSKIDYLKESLFNYVVETDEEGNETTAKISDVEDDYEAGYRNAAFTNYMQTLILNAKANGTSTKEEDVLKAEVLRIYNAYYDSQISVIFQNYFTQEYLLNYQGKGDSTTLNDTAVVKSFLDQYNTEEQMYQIEDAYVSKVTSKDGSSLLLYHYGGTNYYFTVQHILVQYSGYLSEQVKKLHGYSSSGNYDSSISDPYIAERDRLTNTYDLALLGTVNKDAEKDSITTFGNYYYFDENLEKTYNEDDKIYYGYVQLSEYKVENGEYKLTYFEDGDDGYLKDKYDEEDVVLMANYDDILACYEYNYKKWVKLALDVYNGTATLENAVKANPDLEYVFETAVNMKETGKTEQDLKDKIASYLFIELEWIYSSDSLGNEVSNKLGYVISSFDDDNGSWVSDFAIGARDLVDEIDSLSDEEVTRIYNNGTVKSLTKRVISDYGCHIVKIADVYSSNSIINLANISADYDLSVNSEYVQELTELLKSTYICNGSNQTMYEYFYDDLYATLVGDSSTSGTYFLALEYQWLHDLNEKGEIKMEGKVPYSELLDALS